MNVTITRLWHRPEITTNVTDEGISITMPLTDFITALKQEIGGVATTFRKATFEATLDEAVAKVLAGMKEETRKAL